EMGWLPTCHFLEIGKLASNFILGCFNVFDGYDFIRMHPGSVVKFPLSEIHMKPDTEIAMFSAVTCRISGGRPTNHQTCAGHNAVFKRLDDSAIDPRTLSEIVRVHNQVFSTPHVHSLNSSITWVHEVPILLNTISPPSRSASIHAAARSICDTS